VVCHHGRKITTAYGRKFCDFTKERASARFWQIATGGLVGNGILRERPGTGRYLIINWSNLRRRHPSRVILKTVLLVEDNSDDALFMKMACQRAGIPHAFQLLTDGDAAIDYLGGNGVYADRAAHPFPDLMFLDLHLPKRNGHQVLEWIRERNELTAVPVVMLTSSTEPTDISRAYNPGSNFILAQIDLPRGIRPGRPPDSQILARTERDALTLWLAPHAAPRAFGASPPGFYSRQSAKN